MPAAGNVPTGAPPGMASVWCGGSEVTVRVEPVAEGVRRETRAEVSDGGVHVDELIAGLSVHGAAEERVYLEHWWVDLGMRLEAEGAQEELQGFHAAFH